MKRALLILMTISCGPATEANKLITDGTYDNVAWSAPTTRDAGTGGCVCCWPVKYHGPGRCRWARADDAPVDPCESDPEQRCTQPTGGQP